MLKGKKIVLGITGSIAAYKSCLIIRGLVKRGAEVQVVITPAGKEFITPVTLSALTHKPVISDFFAQRDGTWHSHVDLGLWADAMLIAPCTASSIGKMANAIADNMLITTYLSMKAPVFIASGLEGKGRMEEPEKIIETLDTFFEQTEGGHELVGGGHDDDSHADDNPSTPQTMAGRRILITAGPTYEKIDPVRFIGNYSSGKMGFALAEECRRRGARVTLITGPVALQCHPDIKRIDVESCDEMYQAAVNAFDNCDTAILCAAVADFKAAHIADHKIKRGPDGLHIDLAPTQDIAAALGQRKKAGQHIVAFALETNDEVHNAEEKLRKKNADFIVLNSTRIPGTTFRSDDNQISIIHRDGRRQDYPKKSKQEVAKDIVDCL